VAAVAAVVNPDHLMLKNLLHKVKVVEVLVQLALGLVAVKVVVILVHMLQHLPLDIRDALDLPIPVAAVAVDGGTQVLVTQVVMVVLV
jgi:hypothetical protein